MNIFYMIFGEKAVHHVQAYLSIRTFQKQLEADDHIYVMTTHPEYYQSSGVEAIPVTDETIREWKGEKDFFWRVKIKAIEYMASHYPDDHLMYLDTDTILYGSLKTLKGRLDQGCGMMHLNEGHPSGMMTRTLRMWKQINGHTYGGPMYALERGLGMKWLAILFATFTALASFGIGCTVQANSIALLASETFGLPTWIVGIFVCVLAGCVILGGVKAIARVCTLFVPFMALLYVVGCIVILCMNSDYVWPAIKLIVHAAFNPEAVGGGFVGGTVMMAARYGIARGLFSNESGMGSAPIVAAAAQTRNPVRQALVSSTGTFWDTVVICALTGVVLVSSIIAYPDITYDDGAALTKAAFSKIPYVGAPLLTFGILTFAFSTILGWSYYGESAVNYIERQKSNRFYRILYIVVLFFGSIINLDIIWNIADCMNALMTIPNLVALLLLSTIAAKETRKYLWSNRLDEEMEE